MKNKLMRSVTAMVVAVTVLISSQGVVTSFADGGDYSDMSESSSVQMKIRTCPNLICTDERGRQQRNRSID